MRTGGLFQFMLFVCNLPRIMQLFDFGRNYAKSMLAKSVKAYGTPQGMAVTYRNESKRCNLFLAEKLAIAQAPKHPSTPLSTRGVNLCQSVTTRTITNLGASNHRQPSPNQIGEYQRQCLSLVEVIPCTTAVITPFRFAP